MSSRSPRGSVSGENIAAEVAADFEESLKDLQTNNRYEISNLTVIAKENTEHAQAISRALENHIKTTSPNRKLPALYVLDSIVKNVGTPYTVYLGRNLYSTFMDAYTLVDSGTRKHMDAMLRTWKEPVPGSIDTRPVFAHEIVKPLDNAMIRYRTAIAKSQQKNVQQQQPPYRGVGTPPQLSGQFATPPVQGFQPHYPQYGSQQPTPMQQSYAYAPPPQNLATEAERVKWDIDALVQRFQQQAVANPYDPRLQGQITALQNLRTILATRAVKPEELQQISSQIALMSGSAHQQPFLPPQQTPESGASAQQWKPPVPFPQTAYQQPPSNYPNAHSGPSAPTLPPSIPPAALNGLSALLANVPKPSTPQLRAADPSLNNASHSQLNAIQNHVTAAPSANGVADLMASLTRAGILKPTGGSTPSTKPSVDALPTASLMKSLQSVLPPQPQSSTPNQLPMQPALPTSGAPVTAASLKVFRPELVHALYDAHPNQCSTCGRRFQATEEGRQMKSRHLDWHFRTNQRIADPNTNRGHHRNWFVDEMEWIRHIEFDPSTTTATAADQEAAQKPQKGPQDQYVRAPPGMTKSTCSICYEDLKSVYSEDLQDWIFANAAKLNNKIVHATCLAEMTKSQPPGVGASGSASSLAAALASIGAGQRERSATPDSLLGKRKAESSITGGGQRLKMQ